MSGEYRDELAAAHFRIAELENEVRALKDAARHGPRTVPARRFPELESEVERLERATDARVLLRRHSQLAAFGALLPLFGLVFTFMNMPLFAAICGVLFVLSVVSSLSLGRVHEGRLLALEEASAKLADAQRIEDLESRLAESNVRVASDEASPIDEVESGGEVRVRRGA